EGMKPFLVAVVHMGGPVTEGFPGAGGEINCHVVNGGAVLDEGEVRVPVLEVEHPPVKPAFGYRFEARGRKIVISGDCHPSANLIENARAADVLIHEVYLPEYFDHVGRRPEGVARLKRYHSTPEEAGDVASKAGVKLLVFTHLVPPNQESTILERAGKHFAGRIVVGKDLMHF